MDTLSIIKNRLEKEQSKISENPFVNTKGVGVPLEISIDITIKEMIELSNDPLMDGQQKQGLKNKINTYFKGVEMYGEKRVLPVINQFGNIIIWID